MPGTGDDAAQLRVLLVEDCEEDAELLRHELGRSEYAAELVRVETIDGIRTELARCPYDLVISDYTLPEFDARDALRVLQESGHDDIPFIVLSGSISQERLIEILRRGAHGVVLKRDLILLVPVVDRELRAARHRRERLLAEEALRASELRYRELFENANDVIFTIDLDGRFQSLNRAAACLLGYTREEAIARRLTDIVAPDGAEALRARLSARGGEPAQTTFEAMLIGKGGRRIPLEIGWRPIVRDGAVVAFEAIARDLTERRRLEDQLRQAQKMEAVGRLAGGIAHDFNNLLMAVTGYSELLLDRTTPTDPQHRGLEEIRKAASRAAALTRQLLMFSRKHVLEPVVLDVNAVVADLERMLRRLIGEDVELTTSLMAGSAFVKADRGQLEQILMNLVVNARDAMPEGGRLRIATGAVTAGGADQARFPGVAPGEYVVIEVQDTGTGMDTATLSHVFEPFFTTKEPGKGTGLGLSTVYGIVAQAGGSVLVDSEVGRGTQFRVLWPRSAEAARPAADRAHRPTLPLGTEHVLLVEDENGVRELIRDFLARCGYTVIEAGSAPEALELFSRNGRRADVLITDVIMPQMNGRALAERLLAQQPSLKVLYISGYTDDSGVEQSLHAGAGFLQKPFTPDVLARKIREVLDAG